MSELAAPVPPAVPLPAKAVREFDADASDLAPWEQRLDLAEGHQAYHAFCHYRDLDTRARNMSRAYSDHQYKCVGRQLPAVEGSEDTNVEYVILNSSGQWREWRDKYKWDERIALKHAYEDRLEREKAAQAIKDMNRRHAAIATAFLNKVVERIQGLQLDEIPAKDLVAFFDKATAIERRARGEATEIVQGEQTVSVSVSSASEIRKRLREMGILQEISKTIDEVEYTIEENRAS